MTFRASRQTTRSASGEMHPLGGVVALGRGTRHLLRQVYATTRLAMAVIGLSLEPSTWRRTVRGEFLRHANGVAVGGLPAVAGTAALIGLAIASQAFVWIGIVGDAGVVANVLVLTLVTEIAPLFTALIVVGRSATVMSVILGRMTATGQVSSLEALGIDPLRFLVVPRVLAAAVGCFSLTILFVCVSLGMGYVAAVTGGIEDISPSQFLLEVVDAMGPREFVLLPAKSLLAGFASGLIACSIGLSPRIAAGDVQRILPRCFALGSLSVMAISAILTLIL